jgi:hypothetical protein
LVAFETLLLGIVIGRVPVALMVSPPAVSVEMRLDDCSLGRLDAPPWRFVVDLGAGPMPHRLAAVARDVSGREVGRATQGVNLGDERATLSALLERDAATQQPTSVRLAWNSVEDARPQAVVVTLDGKALPVADPNRVAIPKLAMSEPHVLAAEATFVGGTRARADLAFGGDIAEETKSQLTAVAVRVPDGQPEIEVRDLKGVFAVGSTSLEPIGVDASYAEVALVVDQSVQAEIANHQARWASRRKVSRWTPADAAPIAVMPGAGDDRLFAVHTVPDFMFGSGYDRAYFHMQGPMCLRWLAAYPLLGSLAFEPTPPAGQRIAEAVAVAASRLAAFNHRRALVLVLAEPPTSAAKGPIAYDASAYTAAAVKAYLAALDVPLVVWSLTGNTPGPVTTAWGPAAPVPDRWEMQSQARKLMRDLASQRIVWLAGRHLPQRITLDEAKTALRFAR